jgi:hypothetical protein
MALQLAEAELDPRAEAVGLTAVTCASDVTEDDDLAAGRGIVIGILIASPLWGLIALTVYLLL